MFLFRRVKIRTYEAGLSFRDGEFRGVLGAGVHWFFDPLRKVEVKVESRRGPRLVHEKLDLMAASGGLKGYATVVDLKDHERGLLWVDGWFNGVLGPGLHAFWNGCRHVRVETVDVRKARFEHPDLPVVARATGANAWLDVCNVGRGCAGVLFLDGTYADTLGPGLYAFWRGAGDARVVEVDLRELTLEVGGQEIMTADKVTLRLNALVTYKVVDPRRAVCATDDAKQALYREAQLVLRAVVGARDLDALLADKEALAREAADRLAPRAAELGLAVVATGVRDLILPGDMKELMNKVTEARKAAEANLVTRREETAAMRTQVNTAKLLAENPVLMRLRELEVLEKVATQGTLNVVLGEQNLTERILKLV